ncbi:signal peptidase I [Arthrobacter sp. TMN-37]
MLPVLISAVLLTSVLRALVLDVFFIPSASMEPLLLQGDRILVGKGAYRDGGIQRGDVVVFDGRGSFDPISDPRSPAEKASSMVGQWLGLRGSDTVYVKRVVGIGGDRVVCCGEDGRLTVNGKAIDEPYLHGSDAPSESTFDVVVPEGRLWVMGDHRSESSDSRALLGAPGGGFVSEERVLGRAEHLVWPLARAGAID